MAVIFQDRLDNQRELPFYEGETLESVLARHHIPVPSVITTRGDEPIAENAVIDPAAQYDVRLIEGYDIGGILSDVFPPQPGEAAYVKRRVTFGADGSLIAEHVPMSCAEVASMVEDSMRFTLGNYGLVEKGDVVLVGLSGGVDSSALLICLNKLSKELGFHVVAATFEDFDSPSSPAFANAQRLAASLGVRHELIGAGTIEEAFRLNRPLRQILPELMGTKYACFAMYADHHTTRRALELFSERIGANRIALGLHTTDLMAGLLNSYTTGYETADIFKREVGPYTYIYPLMYIPKKELHLYYYQHAHRFAVHTYPNAWELNPRDRNYYYYLADQLQAFFPGMENYLYEAHAWQLRYHRELRFTRCENCGSHILQQDYAPVNSNLCDVCRMLDELHYIDHGEAENHEHQA